MIEDALAGLQAANAAKMRLVYFSLWYDIFYVGDVFYWDSLLVTEIMGTLDWNIPHSEFDCNTYYLLQSQSMF